MKNNIGFILVKPQLGENIGACARSMKNFGFKKLKLVSPKFTFPNHKTKVTSVGAFDIIESAKVFDRIKKRSGDIRLDELIHTAPMSGRELGSLIVFPSWLHHQVTPVTHGVRKSLVVWNKGWPLK